MKKLVLLSLLFVLVVSFVGINKHFRNDKKTINQAIVRGIRLIQPSDRLFLENAGTCHSCHHQDMTAISNYRAKQKGFPVNDTILKENLASIAATLKSRKFTNAQHNDPVAIVMSGTYSLWALAETGYPAGKNLVLQVKNLMQRQGTNGSWVSPNPRPPLEYYAFTATALVVRAMRDYAPPAMKEEVEQRTASAAQWMMLEIPETNEEKVFQLLGLHWAGRGKEFISGQAKQLMSEQRPDGGWAQLYSLETDAYATGQSLYALHECGAIGPGHPVFEKGIAYLLKHQKQDGSWFVKSRSFASVPFVETGFPKEGDQFISAAGSNWALIALLLATSGNE